MNITDRIQQTNGLTLHNEGEWSGTKSRYTAFNSGGVESEVGEFLYGFLRMIKPMYVLETGTHQGIGAMYMGYALQDNGLGLLTTLEILDPNIEISNNNIAKAGLFNHVNICQVSSLDFKPDSKYDFILLDTEPDIRFKEFLKFYPFLNQGGYMFIHDLHRHMQQVGTENGFGWPFGIVPDEIEALLRRREIVKFHFGTPRGLTGFYKVHEGDYHGK